MLYPSTPKRHPVPRQEIRIGRKTHEWKSTNSARAILRFRCLGYRYASHTLFWTLPWSFVVMRLPCSKAHDVWCGVEVDLSRRISVISPFNPSDLVKAHRPFWALYHRRCCSETSNPWDSCYRGSPEYMNSVGEDLQLVALQHIFSRFAALR